MGDIRQVAALSGWVMNCISYRLGLILAVNVNNVEPGKPNNSCS